MTSILVVDDDTDITANLADILDEFGYSVQIANDAESAMERIQSHRFDIAILDFKMPSMDGADLYKEIKRVQSHIVAIMVTAYAGSNGVRRAKDAGTWRVLRKPVEIQMLTDLIEDARSQPIVLIVDDDRDFCENLGQILRERDLRVSIAHDEAAALSQLGTCDFNICLLDLHLGKDMSDNVFRTLKELGQVASTILVTGKRDDSGSVIQRMLKDGAAAVHYKPLDLSDLIQSIAMLTN